MRIFQSFYCVMGNILRPFHLGENFAIDYVVVGTFIFLLESEKSNLLKHLQAFELVTK